MERIWVSISDVLFFQEGPGVRNTQYTTGGVKLLNVANLVDGKVDLTTSDRYISEEEAYGKYKHFLCDVGDFIIASSGIKVEYIDKKMGFIDETMLPLCMNTSTIRFKVLDENQLRIRYFMYYLKSRHFKNQLFKQITGSAQLNYGPSHLKKMIMPLIPLNKQDEIIACMDKVQSVIEMKQQELIRLDDLIKARFVEMFGKCHNMATIEDLCLIITDGTHNPPKFQDKGIPFIFVSNLADNKVTYNTEKYISEETYDELIKRTPIEKGDVLLSTVGSYGHPAVVVEDKKFLFQRHIAYMKPKHDLIDSFYLHGALLAPDGQRQIEEKVKGIAQKTLNLSEIRKIRIPVPSMDKQKEFKTFIETIAKSKVAIQKSLEETQLLFDSLMQKYFG